MPFEIFTAKFTAKPDGQAWSQTWEFVPSDKNQLVLRGKLFVLICIKSPAMGLEIAFLGRKVASFLKSEYYGNLGEKAFTRLKNAIEKTSKEFGTFERIEIAAVSIIEHFAFLAACGGGEIFGLRDGKIFEIIKTKEDEVVSASGKINTEDFLILASSNFFKNFPPPIIRETLGEKDPLVNFNLLTNRFYEEKSDGGKAALVLQIKKPTLVKTDLEFIPESDYQYKITAEPYRVGTKSISLGSALNLFLKHLPQRKIYVREVEDSYSKNKPFLFLGILLLTVLLGGVFFGLKKKKELDLKLRYEKEITSALHNIEEAEEIFNLNPERARELFSVAREKVLGLEAREIDEFLIKDLKTKIGQGQEKFLGEYRVDTQTFVDFSLLTAGFRGYSLADAQEKLFVLDKEGKRIVEVSIETKKTRIVAGPASLEDVEEIAAYSDDVFYADSKGISQVDTGNLVKKDWSGDILFRSYAGNFYILEKDTSKIYRFQRKEKGFAPKQNWLSVNSRADLSKSVSWSIDGSIWILTSDVDILKFTLGERQVFGISGVQPKLTAPLKIFTNEATRYLYVLEPKEKRVVVLDKNGSFKAQYISEKIKDAVDIAVFEEEKKIILLTPESLLIVEIKHL